MERLSGKSILVVADREFASPKLAKWPENTYSAKAYTANTSKYTKSVTY